MNFNKVHIFNKPYYQMQQTVIVYTIYSKEKLTRKKIKNKEFRDE